jgi:hypothetical protein
MHSKTILLWLYNQVRGYDLFIPEKDDYEDDDDHGEAEDPATVLIKQKYTTRIYVLLLMGKKNVSLYLLNLVPAQNVDERKDVLQKCRHLRQFAVKL